MLANRELCVRAPEAAAKPSRSSTPRRRRKTRSHRLAYPFVLAFVACGGPPSSLDGGEISVDAASIDASPDGSVDSAADATSSVDAAAMQPAIVAITARNGSANVTVFMTENITTDTDYSAGMEFTINTIPTSASHDVSSADTDELTYTLGASLVAGDTVSVSHVGSESGLKGLATNLPLSDGTASYVVSSFMPERIAGFNAGLNGDLAYEGRGDAIRCVRLGSVRPRITERI